MSHTDQTGHPEDPLTRASNVLTQFFRHLDQSDYPAMATLLDGEWHRQGKALNSPASLIEALSTRSRTRRIHHLLTNISGEQAPDGSVALTAYMLVVQHEPGGPLDGPAPLDGISSIRTLRATAAPSPDGWRLRWIKSDPQSFAAV
ncbi:MAG: nuclear transport factor 2 family protein [Pseudooceanicola sp.]